MSHSIDLEEVECKKAACMNKRCSDYDSECVDVVDPVSCWVGVTIVWRGQSFTLPIADGYCPILRGDQSGMDAA